MPPTIGPPVVTPNDLQIEDSVINYGRWDDGFTLGLYKDPRAGIRFRSNDNLKNANDSTHGHLEEKISFHSPSL